MLNNVAVSQYSHNKGFCEDLTEGKFSFPVIHSIRADTSNTRLISEFPTADLGESYPDKALELSGVLRQKPNDVNVKNWAVSYSKPR